MRWLDEEWSWTFTLTATFTMVLIMSFLLPGCSTGDKPAQSVENAAAVAQYTLLLDHCRAAGRDAGSYAVYSECADNVDRELCTFHKLRCLPDGGAP